MRQDAERIFHRTPSAEMMDLEWFGEEGHQDEEDADS
jgi:hypothetical protein